MTSLLSLPTELINKIASHLPFSAFVQLQCVNRHLYATCSDHLLRKTVAHDSFMNTSGALKHLSACFSSASRVQPSPEELDWPEGALFLATASAAEVTRVAYAVQRCTNGTMLSVDEQESWTLPLHRDQELFDINTWLPQLLALHHPAALNLEPTIFLSLYRRIGNLRHDKRPAVQSQREAELVNANFILCYLTLQRLSNTRSSALNVLQLFESHFFPMTDDSNGYEPGDEQVIEDTIKKVTSSATPAHGTRQTSLSLLEASSMLPPLILLHCAHFDLRYDVNYLPKPRQIPFSTFMNVRPIYQDFAKAFNICHVPGMTNPEFVAGTWTGIYSDYRGFIRSRSSRPRFDPPMANIRLVTRSPEEGDDEGADDAVSILIDRSSRGVDSHGEFTLEGRILESGAVDLVKRYVVHGWNWNWTGQVTPFGLIGLWGNRGSTGGWFWIWKEEWGVNQ